MKALLLLLFLNFLITFGTITGNPYELLGIRRNADIREVKKAFHKLSLNHHPDKK